MDHQIVYIPGLNLVYTPGTARSSIGPSSPAGLLPFMVAKAHLSERQPLRTLADSRK